ncbi:fatty acid metabolism transcriptional regulator FadR [Gayadomonas joobiniege]|uniref:fatty acid metabolism transcriptional regulator FadR n=1 Tax=Gayadomonas joobiniege TaxID=1234606 RepID=UPI0003602992|nr:fatty acid metabolism transcriptional regulator FadR [Gayadomonas joobiniege]
MYIKANSPAAFAEAYLVESIWNGKYAPGSVLPAERDLSEEIGVTRTTLREVLQRLARDGWLTIQHGKSTVVNDIWQTSGLNILETIFRLDVHNSDNIIDNLLSARTNISAIYATAALKNDPERVAAVLNNRRQIEQTGEAFTAFDYELHHALTMASNNLIYVLIFNGFKCLHTKLGNFYFSHQEARDRVSIYYDELAKLAETGNADAVSGLIREYGYEAAVIFQKFRSNMPPLAESMRAPAEPNL